MPTSSELVDIPKELLNRIRKTEKKLNAPNFSIPLIYSYNKKERNIVTNKEENISKENEKLNAPNFLVDICLPWQKSNGKRRPKPGDFHITESKNVKKEKQRFSYLRATEEARDVFKYWNQQPRTIMHSEQSGVSEKSLTFLETKLFKVMTPEQVKSAILDYNNKSCRTRRKKRSMDLFKFLNHIYRENGGGKEQIPENYYKVYDEMKRLYRKHVVCDGNVRRFSVKQEQQFDAAVKRMCTYIESGKLNGAIPNATYKDYCLHFYQALALEFGSSTKIRIGALCSNYAWSEIWPRYVAENFLAK